MNNPHYFGPAAEDETIVFGARRPGYSSLSVKQDSVDEWIDFMLEKGIQRVVCLLPSEQLDYYDNLLSSYRKAFGSDNVLWAPIKDFRLADRTTLIDQILPFLSDAETHNESAVVHCSGGIGRTGHVLAAWLVSFRGMSNAEAIEVVSRSGRNAKESGDTGLSELLNDCRKRFAY